MRHRIAGRHLNRTTAHRRALRRNLAAALIEHETISTTLPKAKEVKPFVERLITLSKKPTLVHRRRVIALLGNRDVIDLEDGKPVRKGTVVGKLFSELGPRYLDRPGGYTRIIRLSLRRLGDNSKVVLLQLLGKDESLKKKTKAATKRRSRRRKAKPQEAAAVAESSQPAQTPAAAAEETAQSSQADSAAPDQAQEKPTAKPELGKGGKSAKK